MRWWDAPEWGKPQVMKFPDRRGGKFEVLPDPCGHYERNEDENRPRWRWVEDEDEGTVRIFK